MKKLLLFCSILVLCIASACETDFDVAGEWKESIVVYGLLDAGKSAQYIRLNKAFLGENINAYEVAQIADSAALTEPVTAILEEYSDANYSNLTGSFPLTKVNAMDEGIVKEDGTFYTTPYYLYKTTHALSSSKWYGLHVTTGKGTEIRAKTPVIGDFQVTRPSLDSPLNLSGDDVIIRWRKSAAAYFYDADVIFHYAENRSDSPTPVLKSSKINLFKGYDASTVLSGELISYEMPSEDFFAALLRDFDPAAINDPQVITRDLNTIEIAIHAGSEELATFNSVFGAQLSVTASQNPLSYTNIENGLGLFASIYSKVVNELPITSASYPALSCSEEGKTLKFALHPSDPSYPFDCD